MRFAKLLKFNLTFKYITEKFHFSSVTQSTTDGFKNLLFALYSIKKI